MAESPNKISRWPEKERPRERLLQQGAQHLTEAELLGILIGKGKKSKSQPSFKRAKDVANLYLPLMKDLRKEVFRVLLLSRSNRLIKEVTISEGTLDASIVHPRDVFREALLESAAGALLLHNHPSGNPNPSEEDIRITKQLVEAGRGMGIKVYDHIILAGEDYRRLADEGLI